MSTRAMTICEAGRRARRTNTLLTPAVVLDALTIAKRILLIGWLALGQPFGRGSSPPPRARSVVRSRLAAGLVPNSYEMLAVDLRPAPKLNIAR